MSITLGQLADLLKILDDAESDVVSARQALSFGGSAETIARKRENLISAERHLQDLRDKNIDDLV